VAAEELASRQLYIETLDQNVKPGLVVLRARATAIPTSLQEVLAQLGQDWWIVEPIVSQDQILGLLFAWTPYPEEEAKPETIRAASAICALASSVVIQADVLDKAQQQGRNKPHTSASVRQPPLVTSSALF